MNLSAPWLQRCLAWRHRLVPWLLEQPGRIPPATPRNLWLLIAAVVATQNLAVFHTSQNANNTVFALLVWGGALICMEDQLETLEPSPSLLSLLLGTVLLILVMARTAVVLHWEGILFALAPVAGVALALLCVRPGGLARFRDPLLSLMMLPAFALLMRVLPEKPISLITARMAGFWISILGYPNEVMERNITLVNGGVEVLGACNGLDMMSQILCVAVIFLLAFPVRSNVSRLVLFLSAPTIGLLCNSIRIAILALCTTAGNGKTSPMFKFFHEDAGSLVFSGVAVFVFGWLYLTLLERELPPLQPQESSDLS
ncbi:MAG: exosortase/archaeosortase family protein [Synechococcaceae cyanobacterium]|nr:exosortase/archaeosortase family protein [Synechococcaceae cyanobacterium]